MSGGNLWKVGFSLLGAAVVLKGVKQIQEEYLMKEEKKEMVKKRKREGCGLW